MALEVDTAVFSLDKTVGTSSSDDDDEPVQIKRNFKKRLDLSDEEDENLDTSNVVSSLNTTSNDLKESEKSSAEESEDLVSPAKSKKKKRRVVVQKDSDESDADDPEPRPSSRSSDKEDEFAIRQQKILESLRSENAESSEDETRPTSGRCSRSSNHSEDEIQQHSKTKSGARPKPPARKSAAACKKAMLQERLKMISESQRMVRESEASLPYHKPRQRSLKEFLSARFKPNPLLRGTKFQNIDITVIGQELEEREKLAEEFYKPESDEEEKQEKNFTPPAQSEANDDEDRVLKVLLHTREELEKNIQSNTISDLKCATSDKEDTHSDTITTDKVTDSNQESPSAIISNGDPAAAMDVEDSENAVPPSSNQVEPMETETTEVKENELEQQKESAAVNISSAIASDVSSDLTSEVSNQDSQTNLTEASKTEALQSSKPTVLTKLNLAAELEDACLTPSDALKDSDIFLKPVAKTPVEEKRMQIEENVDSEDFHLFFEDSDDILKNCKRDSSVVPAVETIEETKASPEKTNKEKTSEKIGLDLAKLYNSTDLLSSDEEEVAAEPTELKGKSQIISKFKLSTGPIRLKGGPDEVIDLDESVEPRSGVKDLMQRFIRQSTTGQKKKAVEQQGGILSLIKAGEKIDDTPDLKAKPGEKMKLLKSEMRDSIAKQRDEEFKRRQKEYQMYDDETEGLLGDDEEEVGKVLTDDEIEELDKKGAESDGSTETEPELEDDVELSDKPKPQSEFMDDEAEVSEQEGGEENEEEAEDVENEEEVEEEVEKENEEDSSSSDSEEEIDKTETTPSGSKRKFQRIQVVVDSDEENDTKDVTDNKEVAKNEIPETQLDTQPLDDLDDDRMDDDAVYDKSFNLSMLETSGTELKLKNKFSGSHTDLTQIDGENYDRFMPQGITQLIQESSTDLPTQRPSEKQARGFSKELSDLFQSTESLTDNLEDLCSGQFKTQTTSVPRSLNKLIQSTDSLPDDVEALCSGQFETQEQTHGISKEINKLVGNTDTQTDDFAALCSGQFITQAPPSDLDKLVGGLDTQPDDLADLCSGQFATQVNTQNNVPSELNKLITGTCTVPDNLEEMCSGQFFTQNNESVKQNDSADNRDVKDATEEVTNGNNTAAFNMRIVSDDEDDEPTLGKKKKKGKRKLAFSDEEDESADEDAVDSDAEEAEMDEEGGYVDYDSEENEIVVSEPQKRIKPKQFFENEAELSESEWGSADEDEKGLDLLEEELGDKEEFDEHDMKEALGKIHARRMLDEDKHDVRLFQEAFLEDGDLHSEGGGRQKLFRWKNNDDGDWAPGANPNFSGDEGGDEDEEEESKWRTARLERETWLQANKDKQSAEEVSEDNSNLLMLGRTLLAKMGNNRTKNGGNNNNKSTSAPNKVDPSSPGKVIRQTLQRKSGSFLARRSISVTRVVAMTGGDGENTTIVNSSSNRNFVFCSVSPASVKAAAEKAEAKNKQDQLPAPVKKRASSSRPGDKPPVAKKKKVTSSVFQHLK